MRLIYLLMFVLISGNAYCACYSNVTVNWVSYPEWHDGFYDENSISVSLSGENTTGNHQASFRNLSAQTLSGLMSMLLMAKAAGNKISVTCANDERSYTAKNIRVQ